ncbi:MAG: hypothetical protein IKO65_10210 [Victivallales bacterium]|nr:hypothetical protein [Victivallales bacterium]
MCERTAFLPLTQNVRKKKRRPLLSNCNLMRQAFLEHQPGDASPAPLDRANPFPNGRAPSSTTKAVLSAQLLPPSAEAGLGALLLSPSAKAGFGAEPRLFSEIPN